MADSGQLRVTVAWSPGPRHVEERELELPPGSTLADALIAAGLSAQALPRGVEVGELLVGVWGRKAATRQILRDRDRVELYRPLKVDPKVARRERFVRQGSRGTGLFARQRVAGKPGC